MGDAPTLVVTKLFRTIAADVLVSGLWETLEALLGSPSREGENRWRVLCPTGNQIHPMIPATRDDIEERLTSAAQARQRGLVVKVNTSLHEDWSAEFYLSTAPHLTMRTFADLHVDSAQSLSSDTIDLARDRAGNPIFGRPVETYVVVKMETKAFWSTFLGEFGGAAVKEFACFLDVLSRSSIARMKVPSTRREMGNFLQECDKVVASEVGDDVLTGCLGFVGVSAKAWLRAR